MTDAVRTDFPGPRTTWGLTTTPVRPIGWWAIGLSIIGMGSWLVLPLITTLFAETYPVTNTGLMPVIGVVLILIASVANVVCLWVWKERSALNIVAAVLTLPWALLTTFITVGELLGGA